MKVGNKKLILGTLFSTSLILVFILGSISEWILSIIGISTLLSGYIISGLYIISFALTFYGIYLLINNATVKNLDLDESKVVYSGFWRRFLAYVIDALLGYLIIPIIFNLYFWFKDGQTIGYKALGIRIYKIEGEKIISPTGTQLILYPFAKILSSLTLLIGFIMIAFTKRKQGLHNIISNTVVILVKKNKEGVKIEL